MLDVDAGHGLPLLTDAALKSAVVLTVTLALSAVLRRASAATRHLALLAGIAVLLGLPLLMLFVPRQSLPPAASWLPKPSAPPPARIAAALVPVMPIVAPAPVNTAAEMPAPPLTSAPSLPSPAVVIKPHTSPLPYVWPTWIVCVWLAGVLLYACRVLAAQARIGRLIRRCPPSSCDWLAAADAETALFARLQTSPTGTPPMVWGWPRPILLLPSDAAQWPEARLRAVLWHEAAHVRRQDWLTQTLTQAACALYWFNPLVWLTASQMQAEAERACDDAVLLAGIPPADYAQDLLAVARSLTAAQRASFGAVTMARHSPVRTRLEAILDPARPRRRTTRRAAALALTLAFAVAVPLAALRPAARAAAPALDRPAPFAAVPTEADIANVQRHLQRLEQAQATYAAMHPNTLTAAQTAEIDRFLREMEIKRSQDQFNARMAAEHKQLRAESKKPHTKAERQQIWACIFAYEHTPKIVLQRRQAEAQWFARQNAKFMALPAPQRVRAVKIYDSDNLIALDQAQMDKMGMERAAGYPLNISREDMMEFTRMGLQMEREGSTSHGDWMHLFLLEQKFHQAKALDDADIDSLIAMLRTPSKPKDITHVDALAIFRQMRDVPLSRQQKIREAVTPLLTSSNKWDRRLAQQVLKKFGGSVPAPPSPHKAQAAPASAALPAPQSPKPTGVSPMPPIKSIKAALLKTAAFATLAAGLTPLTANAQPVTSVKPATPAPTIASATDVFHWYNISLHHASVGNNPAFARWHDGDILPGSGLPEGVKRLFFLTKDNAILVQATADGFAKMQELVNQIDVVPHQVQIKTVMGTISGADLDAFGISFALLPLTGPGLSAKGAAPVTQLKYIEGNAAVQLLTILTKRGSLIGPPATTASDATSANFYCSAGGAASDVQGISFVLIPHVNGDDTVTLHLNRPLLHDIAKKDHSDETPADTTQEPEALCTVKSGSTMMLAFPLPAAAGESARYFLLFVTPTVLPGRNAAPTQSG